jgi:predicted dehydrogenase
MDLPAEPEELQMPEPAAAAGAPAIGVGFLGAGPVTQAIHLPSLARLGEALRVAHVMDVDSAVASTVAARVGASHSASMESLLDDPAVDVVAICSPHQFHAAQVIAACRAGKKAVLCEKPFAVSAEEAAEIAAVSAETGVPILVGAMHTFDPGWLAAEELAGGLLRSAHTLRSSIVLPPNARFEDFATEVIARPAAPERDLEDPAVVAAVLEGGILGLAIHDLPLVRRFVPDFADLEVLRAEAVRPFGYVVLVRAGGRTIELTAQVASGATAVWKPDWTFEAVGPDSALAVTFTPSYVQAGSAVAELTAGGRTQAAGPFGHNGYEGEWRRIAGIVGGTEHAPAASELIDDLRFALAIVDGARAHVLEAAA